MKTAYEAVVKSHSINLIVRIKSVKNSIARNLGTLSDVDDKQVWVACYIEIASILHVTVF